MALIEMLLPPSCAGCGRYGSLLCDACRASFRSASPAAVTFVQADPSIVMGEALTLALAAFRYEAAVRSALQRLKYGASARLAKPLALAARPAFERLMSVCGPLPIVPVPVHPDRPAPGTRLQPGGAACPLAGPERRIARQRGAGSSPRDHQAASA